MLTTPQAAIAVAQVWDKRIRDSGVPEGYPVPVPIGEGFLISDMNLQILLQEADIGGGYRDSNAFEPRTRDVCLRDNPDFVGVPEYGVCDYPMQFIGKFGIKLVTDRRRFCVAFTHIEKRPGEQGGWRWHKWGEYIGTGTPRHEYLDDEEEFENGVWVFSCYELKEGA